MCGEIRDRGVLVFIVIVIPVVIVLRVFLFFDSGNSLRFVRFVIFLTPVCDARGRDSGRRVGFFRDRVFFVWMSS